MNTELHNFLEELKDLCIKYKVEIDGCGCCGSPVVYQEYAGRKLCHKNLHVGLGDDEKEVGVAIKEDGALF